MRKLFFKKNKCMKQNHFQKELNQEVSKMLDGFFKDDMIVPNDFNEFEKEIDNLVIHTIENDEIDRKGDKKMMKNKWKRKKFIK